LSFVHLLMRIPATVINAQRASCCLVVFLESLVLPPSHLSTRHPQGAARARRCQAAVGRSELDYSREHDY
jgi:hypothetical protein